MRDKRPHLILAGAGHAHLALAADPRFVEQSGARVTLISPGRFWYSGMATQMLGGGCSPSDLQADPARLAARSGMDYLDDRIECIDPEARTVTLQEGGILPFDILSLNIGSTTDAEVLEGAAEHAYTVKPIGRLLNLQAALLQRRRDRCTVSVIGGGATACEVAGNIESLARSHGTPLDICIFTNQSGLLPQAPDNAGKKITEELSGRGIHIHTGVRIARVTKDAVVTDGGDSYASEVTVLATGLVPPPLLFESGLAPEKGAGMPVAATLQSRDYPSILGVGDCIDFEGSPLPRLGVFGVRQAPVLKRNILALLHDKPLEPYRPQKRWLSILHLGDDRPALAIRGRAWAFGRWCFHLKHWIDRRFMRKYQRTAGRMDPPS